MALVGFVRFWPGFTWLCSHIAAIDIGLHTRFCLGDLYRLDITAALDSAISYSELAHPMSNAVYNSTEIGRPIHSEGLGSSEKSGKSNGAYILSINSSGHFIDNAYLVEYAAIVWI
jgi:hypothetical protein